MTKEQIKQIAEEMIEAQIYESGLEREDVIETSMLCFLDDYIKDEIAKEDLLEFATYLCYPIDIEAVEALKSKRKKQAEYRARYKAKKKLERQKRREELVKQKEAKKYERHQL